jgi:hypothetical protein
LLEVNSELEDVVGRLLEIREDQIEDQELEALETEWEES